MKKTKYLKKRFDKLVIGTPIIGEEWKWSEKPDNEGYFISKIKQEDVASYLLEYEINNIPEVEEWLSKKQLELIRDLESKGDNDFEGSLTITKINVFSIKSTDYEEHTFDLELELEFV